MGNQQSFLSNDELNDYQTLTFLTRNEIIKVLKRFSFLTKKHSNQIKTARLSAKAAVKISELQHNPFAERIVEVFSSQPDGSLTFEDFLDMMSVFSKNAPKSVKVSYAFKIYQGIAKRSRTNDAIDLDDIREIVHRLSEGNFNDQELTSIAQSVISEVDLRDEKKITSEIFEYFLSNIPDFPSSFVIPISDETKR